MDRIKILLICFFSISCAEQSILWDSGYIYHYIYRGAIRIETSKVLNIEAEIAIKTRSTSHLIFKIGNLTSKRISDKIATIEETESIYSEFHQLQSEFHAFLENNTVKTLAYPLNAKVKLFDVNFHRSIASAFNFKMPSEMSDGNSYTAEKQEEITGTCDNIYDWSYLGNQHWMENTSSICSDFDAHQFELVKTRDFDRCSILPLYNFLAPAALRCNPSSAICENVQSRSLVERFLFCGQREKLNIAEIELQEDWISLPWGTKHEPFERVQIIQHIQLVNKTEHNPTGSKNEEFHVEHYSLLYSFNLEQEFGTTSQVNSTEIIMQDIILLHYYTMNILNDQTIITQRSISELRIKILNLFRSLNSEQLQSLTKTARKQLDSQHWSLFLRQMTMLGSSVTLDIVKQLIEEEAISVADATVLVSEFSMFLREPTDHVLQQLMDLFDIKLVRESSTLRQTVMVSLASFFRIFWTSEAHFPTNFFNTSSKDEWLTKLVERLSKELKNLDSGDRSAVFSAFNILGHPSLISKVLPYIEGKIEINPSVKAKSVLALHKLAHHGNPDAIKILHAIFVNSSENYEVRLAAFTLLILSDPEEYVWQSIAVKNWFEPQSHVSSFVFTALSTLASFESPLQFLQKLSLKARKVLRFTRPIISDRLSANYIWSHEKKRQLLASYLRLETFVNKKNFFPKEIYGRFNLNIGAVDFDFMEFEIHGHNIEELVAHVLFEWPEFTEDCIDRQNTPLNAFLKRLNVTYHPEEPSEAIMHLTLMESVEKFWSFKSAAKRFLTNFINGRTHIQWLHQLPIVNVDIRFANSLGSMTKIQVGGQLDSTLNGPIHFDRKSDSLRIETQINPTIALEIRSDISIQFLNNPQHKISSGSNVLLVASIPGQLNLHVAQQPKKQFQIQWKAPESSQELVFYHKSHCTNIGVCPVTKQRDWSILQNLLQMNWKQMLSNFGFFWLPDRNEMKQSQQLSWSRLTSGFSSFQISTEIDRENEIRNYWTLHTSNESFKTRTLQNKEGSSLYDKDNKEKNVLEKHLHNTVRRAAKVDLNSDTAQNSFTDSSWLQILSKIGFTSGDRIRLKWEIPLMNDTAILSATEISQRMGYWDFTMKAGKQPKCLVETSKVTTFDGIVYNPQTKENCQYLILASIETELIVLVDRSNKTNQILRFVFSHDDVAVDILKKTVSFNGTETSLSNNHKFILKNVCLNRVDLIVSVNDDTLTLKLPSHGLLLETRSIESLIKVKSSFNPSRVNGVCQFKWSDFQQQQSLHLC